jgi:hypothetical protein
LTSLQITLRVQRTGKQLTAAVLASLLEPEERAEGHLKVRGVARSRRPVRRENGGRAEQLGRRAGNRKRRV